jgi:hypothetical protein
VSLFPPLEFFFFAVLEMETRASKTLRKCLPLSPNSNPTLLFVCLLWFVSLTAYSYLLPTFGWVVDLLETIFFLFFETEYTYKKTWN